MRGEEVVRVATGLLTPRSTYRHGDLLRALVEAGTELARVGGPDAVVLREVTRRVGVAPNAAYRHVADRQALLQAVCDEAQALLANAMEDELVSVPAKGPLAKRSRAQLRAVGTGYLRFAQDEPGLFRTAFWVPDDMSTAGSLSKAGRSGLTPFQLLGSALDNMVAAGVLAEDRRPGAEFLAWSSVHGLALLLIDGPLRGLSREQAHDAGQGLIDMVERGL